MRHIDQYRVRFYEGGFDPKPFKRVDDPFEGFSGVYEHTYSSGYVVTTVPHEDGRCEEALETCDGRCEREVRKFR